MRKVLLLDAADAGVVVCECEWERVAEGVAVVAGARVVDGKADRATGWAIDVSGEW